MTPGFDRYTWQKQPWKYLTQEENQEPLCMCKDRPLSQCAGEWEPGCDLGNNPDYVAVSDIQPIKFNED